MNRNYSNVPRMARILCALSLLLTGWSATACETEVPRRVAGPVTTLAIPNPCPENPPEEPPIQALSARFVGQSVPTQMVVGQSYAVSLTFRNNGTTPWQAGQNFNLGSQLPGDNMRWGLGRVGVPGYVQYDQQVTFNFTVTAPTQPGTYDFQWKMVQDGVAWFGLASLPTQITVIGSAIKGNIDGVTGTHVRGWACSRYIEGPIDVHLYVGGAYGQGTGINSARADQPGEAAIAAECGTQGSAHRFQIPLPPHAVLNYPTSLIYVHGISPVGAANSLIGSSGVHRVPYNGLPTISMTSPNEGAVVGEGNPIVLKATASDPDDGVAQVTFWGDGQQLGSTSPPNHTYNWYTTPGDHNVRAYVSDTRGEGVFSATRNVHVSRVIGAITSLNSGVIRGWACSTRAATSVNVHLYVGGQAGVGTYAAEAAANITSSDEVNAACGAGTKHNFSITPSAAVLAEHVGKSIHVHGISRFGSGNHLLEGSGNFTLRANQAPIARITSPSAGAILPQPGNVLFTADASDPDGTVSQVQLLLNGTAVATLTAPPYQYQLTDLPVGTHTLRAIAKDARSATGSHQITIKVEQGQAPSTVARQYVYDPQQQLCKVIEPETGSTVMDYDAGGNLVWSAAGLNLPSATSCDREAARTSGRRVDRTYDTRNRLLTLTFPDGNGNQQWQYTPDGLPAQVTTWNEGGANTVVNTYTYNKRRLLIGETVSVNGGAPVAVGYSYDANGSMAGQVRPGGLSLQYQPNALGQPTQVRDTSGQVYAQNITWHPGGSLARLQYGNGVQHQTVLNARQFPAQLRDSGALALNYAYDANGNVTAILDQQQGTSKDVRMQYDGHNRLVQASSAGFGGDGKFRYRYDALDNLVSSHLGGVKAHNYWYDAKNRLTNVRDDSGATTIGLTYDVQGNLANRNGQLHTFDFGNRLREVPGVERYRYDAHGRRVTATDANGQRLFSLYGNDGTLLHEQRRDRGTMDYIHLGKRLLATRSNGVVTWQHNDALGSPVVTTNGAGAVVERKQFEPYGASVGAATDGVGYTGHVMDAGTGLTYMQQRYMDPVLGVFLSVDPVTAYGSPVVQFNRYRYGNGNPFNFTDPDGRKGKGKACGKDTGCRLSQGERGGWVGSGVLTDRSAAEAGRIAPIATQEANDALAPLSGKKFDSAGKAARAWANLVRPVANKHNTEIGSILFYNGSKITLGPAVSDGYINAVDLKGASRSSILIVAGFVHTHPGNSLFSKIDKGFALDQYRRTNGNYHGGLDATAFVSLANGRVVGWKASSYYETNGESYKNEESYSDH
jgi:RHS repeat-associated protein